MLFLPKTINKSNDINSINYEQGISEKGVLWLFSLTNIVVLYIL